MTIRKRLFVGLLGLVLADGSKFPFFASDAANATQQDNISIEYQLPSSKFPDYDIRLVGKGEFMDKDFTSASGKQIAGRCPLSINPTSASYAAGGGTGSVSVTAAADCNWTAVSNATFITITSGASGSGNGTINYSVASNTGTSSRNGTMTIAELAFTVTQTGTSGGTELITNPGFETGTTPWIISGQVTRSTGTYPHSDLAYMIVNGVNSTSGTLYQTLTIPTGAACKLSFWLNITTSEAPSAAVDDRLFLEVWSTSGTLLATLTTFSNQNSGTGGVYVLRGPYNLSAFAGQTVRIQFRGTNDITLPTSFRVDDVSVQ